MAEKQEEVSAEEMSVLDAVDHLSSMAELDVQVPEEEDVRAKLHSFKELAEKEKEETLSTVKSSFKTIHNYLKQVYQQDKEHLKDVEMQRGIQAVMVLAEEAAEKIGTCSSLFQHTFKEGKLTEIKEFQELKDFYFNKIIKRFQEALAKEEKWKETWEEGQQNLLDIERMALKDLETVKRDQSYELFYIRKEDGNPFFNRNLLRHIRLVHDFDELIRDAQGVDPLLSTGGLLDREVQRRALAIKEKVKDSLADFYLEAMKYKEVPVVKEMNKCVFSLFLAANPRNLQQNTIGKSCTLYFTDFKMYLREVLRFSTYRSLLSKPLKGLDKISRTLIELVHHLCYIFYLYFDSHTEALDFIYDVLGREQRKKRERKKEGRELLPFLDEVLDDYDHINKTLKRYPNGPLFKTIDIFYQRGQKEGFDPIYQGNHPAALYKMVSKSFDASCLRLPSPTFHHHVNIAEVNEEFSGFCRYLKQEKTQGKHLLFNLQDRTFWQESARCQALEKLQEEEELEGSLIVVTIPKRTPFYEQISPYNEIDGAEVFIDLFKEELFSSKECGFFFPKGISLKEMKSFTNEILPLIHTYFFEKKQTLMRKERLDFIEIFYSFFLLKIIDLVKPTSFSFSCKDAVDTGMAASAGFFSFLKMVGEEDKWSIDEQELFIWMVFAPALLLRERMVAMRPINRMVSALSLLHAGLAKEEKKIKKELESLYDFPLLKDLGVEIFR